MDRKPCRTTTVHLGHSGPIIINMEKTIVSYLRIEPANNGAVISFEEKTAPSGKKNTFDNCSYKPITEAFECQESETIDQCLDRAMSRFTALWKKQHAGKY
jgi:hypothetical protein